MAVLSDEKLEPARISFRFLNTWNLVSYIIFALILLPIITVAYLAFFPKENIWPHLLQTTLSRYFSNSLVIMISTGLFTGFIGVFAAWLVAIKDFPGRKIFEWALLLPLSIPTYIAAYALVDFWEYAGPFQTWLRNTWGFKSTAEYWFPEIRSRGAAIFVFSFALYPYVYLLTRASFREQSACVIETSRTLGCGPWTSFFKVGLPLARPAIVIGVAIVMMETLNDFGAVEFFAVQTLTTGIFTVWLEASNAGGAAQIALVILGLVFILLILERNNRQQRKFYHLSKSITVIKREPLSAGASIGAILLCLILIGLGFFMPFLIMLKHALKKPELWIHADLWSAAFTTLWVGIIAACVTIISAVILVYAVRLSAIRAIQNLMPVTTIGYAAPGAVIGLGLLIPIAALDHKIADAIEALIGIDIGLLMTGTATAVILAYSIRFFAIAFGAVDSTFSRISPNLSMASRSLGQTTGGTLKHVYYPLMRGSLIAAALLIFIDSAKELPATLLLRPFGFETLATHIYGYASLENISSASPASIVIILLSLIAVLIVFHTFQKTAHTA